MKQPKHLRSRPVWQKLRDTRRLRKEAKRAVIEAETIRNKAFGQYNIDVLSLIASNPYSAKIKVRRDKVIMFHGEPLTHVEFLDHDNPYFQELMEQVKLEEAFHKARKEVSAFYEAARKQRGE